MDTFKILQKSLSKKYDTKDLREVKTIIGWQINRDIASGTMKISQSVFIQDLVIEEGLTECNANVIPMKAGSTIEMTEPEDYEKADLRIYQRLIGKLMYLACGKRPNISFVVGQLSRHNVNPRKGYLGAAKRVVQYLRGTMEMGLMYSRKLNNQMSRDPLLIGLIGFADSSFAGDLEDRKLVMGYCFFLKE